MSSPYMVRLAKSSSCLSFGRRLPSSHCSIVGHLFLRESTVSPQRVMAHRSTAGLGLISITHHRPPSASEAILQPPETSRREKRSISVEPDSKNAEKPSEKDADKFARRELFGPEGLGGAAPRADRHRKGRPQGHFGIQAYTRHPREH